MGRSVRSHVCFVSVRQAFRCRLQHLSDCPRRDPSTCTSLFFSGVFVSVSIFCFIIAGWTFESRKVNVGGGRFARAPCYGVVYTHGTYGGPYKRQGRVQTRCTISTGIFVLCSFVSHPLPFVVISGVDFHRCASFQQELIHAMNICVPAEAQRGFGAFLFLLFQIHHASTFPPRFHGRSCIGYAFCLFGIRRARRLRWPWDGLSARSLPWIGHGSIHDIVLHACFVQRCSCTWCGFDQQCTRTSMRASFPHEPRREVWMRHQQMAWMDAFVARRSTRRGVSPRVVRAAKGVVPTTRRATAARPHVCRAQPCCRTRRSGRLARRRGEATHGIARFPRARRTWERRRARKAHERLARAVPWHVARLRRLAVRFCFACHVFACYLHVVRRTRRRRTQQQLQIGATWRGMARSCVCFASSFVVARQRRRAFVLVHVLVDRFVLGVGMRRFQTLQQRRHATAHDAHTRARSHHHHCNSAAAQVLAPTDTCIQHRANGRPRMLSKHRNMDGTRGGGCVDEAIGGSMEPCDEECATSMCIVRVQ